MVASQASQPKEYTLNVGGITKTAPRDIDTQGYYAALQSVFDVHSTGHGNAISVGRLSNPDAARRNEEEHQPLAGLLPGITLEKAVVRGRATALSLCRNRARRTLPPNMK